VLLPVECLRGILASLIDVLNHAHGLGVVHCDVKPANVLLPDPSLAVALLGDWGMCQDRRAVLAGTQAPILGFTPGYLPPEIIHAHDQHVMCSGSDAVSECLARVLTHPGRDWWALGVTALEMVLGPVQGSAAMRELHARLSGSCSRSDMEVQELLAGALPADSPPGLVALLAGLLSSCPEQRVRAGQAARQQQQQHPFFEGFDWGALSCAAHTARLTSILPPALAGQPRPAAAAAVAAEPARS